MSVSIVEVESSGGLIDWMGTGGILILSSLLSSDVSSLLLIAIEKLGVSLLSFLLLLTIVEYSYWLRGIGSTPIFLLLFSSALRLYFNASCLVLKILRVFNPSEDLFASTDTFLLVVLIGFGECDLLLNPN